MMHQKKVLDFPIKRKDKVLGTLKKFHMVFERETNKLLRCIRTNNGGDYFSKAFKEYCSKLIIKHVKIVHHTPKQSGIVKRLKSKNNEFQIMDFLNIFLI